MACKNVFFVRGMGGEAPKKRARWKNSEPRANVLSMGHFSRLKGLIVKVESEERVAGLA